MIIAIAVCNTDRASPNPEMLVVDTNKVSAAWKAAIEEELAWQAALEAGKPFAPCVPLPEEWESLEAAQVELPATIEAVAAVYYDG